VQFQGFFMNSGSISSGKKSAARESRPLLETDLDPNPFEQFRRWLDEASAANIPEPNAMTLATATLGGRPSARIVLLRGYGETGFTFYTNYESHKGQELAANPQAALVFFWPELERQVRVEGRVIRTPADDSDAYFRTRPLGSRLGAWASPQSAVIPSREHLQRLVHEVATRYPDGNVPRPLNWGGYCLVPILIEFWQGQPSRLHDRLCYRRTTDDIWAIERLGP
jgi:pyridoxamine 5'-phosphate oxidase